MRLSHTVSSVSRLSSWGTTPTRARIRGPSDAGSRPSTRTVPPLTGDTHPIIRMVELLPAPLGPRKPNASPGEISKSMPSTATKPPKRFVSARASINASPIEGDASQRLRQPRGGLRSVLAARREALCRNAHVGRAAQAELDVEVDLATGREPERRITRPWILEIELVADGAARQVHPAGYDGVEQAVQRRRVVVDHAVTDTTVSAQSTLARTTSAPPASSFSSEFHLPDLEPGFNAGIKNRPAARRSMRDGLLRR